MIRHISSKVNICSLLVFGFLSCGALDSAWAQRGRGGFGFDRNSPFRMVSDEEIQDELKLTDDQSERLEKLEEELQEAQSQEPRPQFPGEGEDRTAFFAAIRKQQEDRNNAAMAKIKEVLQDSQYQRLEQIRLQRIGVSALGTEPIAAELKLNQRQRDDLSKLLEEFNAVRYNFRASREEREKSTEEFTEKIMAVLSAEQKSAWEAKLGPALEEDNDGDNRGPSTTANASETNSAPMTTPAPSYTPPQTDGPVVVSLDGSEAKAPADAGNGPAPAAKTEGSQEGSKPIQFHMENAPWELVLKQFAQRADLTLQILDLPPGSLTYTNDDKWYTPVEALDILHGYLLQMGHVMIQRDRFLVVLNLDVRPIPPNLIPNIPISDLDSVGKYGKHQLVNVVLPLEGAEANDAAREVEALKGPQGTVVPLSVSNSLVVTDTFSNVRRIHNLLKGVTTTDPEAQSFKSFPLEHIVAEEAATIVRDQLGLPAPGSSSSDRSRFSFPFSFQGRDSRDSRNSSSRSTTPSVASTAKVTPDGRTNALLVTATKNELAIVEQILTTIDIEATGRDSRPYLHVYHIKKADVDEIRRTLDTITPGLVVGEDEDRDGGRIHVKATPRQHEQVAELIGKMDGTGGLTSTVIPLSSYDPLGVASMLNGMFASDGELAPTILADSSTRRLMVRGSSEQLAEIRKFLSDLGEDGTGNGANQDRGGLRTIPLGGRDAVEFARIIEQIWSNNSDTPLRVVIPSNNPIQRQVIPSTMEEVPVSNPASQLRTRSNEIDPKSTAVPGSNSLFPVSMKAEASEPAPARAERPADDPGQPVGAPAPVTLRLTKSGEMRLDGETFTPTQLSIWAAKWINDTPADERQFILRVHPETPALKLTPILGVLDRAGVKYGMEVSADDLTDGATNAQSQSEAPAEKSQPTVATNAGKVPIMLTVRGGELVLLDPTGKGQELDKMEAMIEQLALAMPPKTSWTVYYLRSADVTETAIMLEQLFPSSSISASAYDDGSLFGGLTSGLASLGGGLADATGINSLTQSPTTLRIIPELRSNSLFVSGPADQVRQVEQVLRVLDADELPETLRDRVPRMIPVEYANVAEVANILKEVYRTELEDSRQSQGRNNPLAALMGGNGNSSSRGGSRGGNNGPSTVKMTLGVDTQTSKIIVSASDALFQQVKETVEELDKAAFEARRTVQVVPVSEASSQVLQQALTALLPNVSVSTTSSSSSNSRSGDNNRSDSDDAARRARYEEYFRSRSSGDSNRSTGGTRRIDGGGDSSSRWGGSSRGSDSGRSGFSGFGRGGDSGRGGFSGFGRGGDSRRGR